MLHTRSIDTDMKTIKANGTKRVKSIEFFVFSPMDIIWPASSTVVIGGRNTVVVKFIFAVTFVLTDWKINGFLTLT